MNKCPNICKYWTRIRLRDASNRVGYLDTPILGWGDALHITA